MIFLPLKNCFRFPSKFSAFKLNVLHKFSNILKPKPPHLIIGGARGRSSFTYKCQDKPLCHRSAHLLLQQVAEEIWP